MGRIIKKTFRGSYKLRDELCGEEGKKMKYLLLTFLLIMPLFPQSTDTLGVELPCASDTLCWKYKICFDAKPNNINSFFRIYVNIYSKEKDLNDKIIGWRMTYSLEPGFYKYTQERFKTGYDVGFERGVKSLEKKDLKNKIIIGGVFIGLGVLIGTFAF